MNIDVEDGRVEKKCVLTWGDCVGDAELNCIKASYYVGSQKCTAAAEAYTWKEKCGKEFMSSIGKGYVGVVGVCVHELSYIL